MLFLAAGTPEAQYNIADRKAVWLEKSRTDKRVEADTRNRFNAIADNLRAESSRFIEQRDAYGRILATPDDDRVLFSGLRILAAAPIPDRVLRKDDRADLLAFARRLFESAKAQQIERNKRYLERARLAGIPEELIDNLPIPVQP